MTPARCSRGSQCLQLGLWLLCSQIWLLPQKRQYDPNLFCAQLCLRPHPLDLDFILLCSQIWLPHNLCKLILACFAHKFDLQHSLWILIFPCFAHKFDFHHNLYTVIFVVRAYTWFAELTFCSCPNTLRNTLLILSWWRPLANQWTGFYMKTASVMKGFIV